MGALATSTALLGLIAAGGPWQTRLPEDPLASRSLNISNVPIVDPPARDYQNFFNEVKDLGKKPLTVEARRTLRLSDQELRSLVAVTADLADESVAFHKIWRPWRFEAFMERVEGESVAPAVEEKLRDLQKQWAQTLLEYAERLKAALGEERFRSVDEFIHSGKSMFAR
jgi:hypothetical protein